MEKLKKKIRYLSANGDLEGARKQFEHWATLLEELLIPPHQDFVNVRRGMRNCLWLRSPNICKAREDEELKDKKAKYREKTRGKL